MRPWPTTPTLRYNPAPELSTRPNLLDCGPLVVGEFVVNPRIPHNLIVVRAAERDGLYVREISSRVTLFVVNLKFDSFEAVSGTREERNRALMRVSGIGPRQNRRNT